MMTKSLQDKMNSLSKERKDLIQERANQLIAEEMTLRDLRLALEKTQADLGEILHMKQEGISRLEKRSDMLISTLSKYISAMGGSLKLMAEFPNRKPIEIHGIGISALTNYIFTHRRVFFILTKSSNMPDCCDNQAYIKHCVDALYC